MFTSADVSVSSREAPKRRATLSQSPAMQSALPPSVTLVQPSIVLLESFYKMAKFYLATKTFCKVQLQCNLLEVKGG